MAADDLLSRGEPADARGDRRPALRPPLPLHRLRRRSSTRSREVAGGVNLALSLLAASERAPGAEAFPGSRTRLTYAELRARGADRRRTRAPASGEATASRSCSTTAGDRALLGCQWPARVVVPLSWRLSERSSTTASATAAREIVVRDPATSGAAVAAGAPRRARPRRARDVAPALHLGHDRPAEGRAALAPRRPRRRAVAGAAARLRLGDRTLGVMPLYHTMGIHSLLACTCRRRVLRAAAALGRRAGARLIESAADHLALPRPDALPRPRPPPGFADARHLVRPRARLCGRGDDVRRSSGAARRSSRRRSSSTTTGRPRSTPTRSAATSSRSPAVPGARA